MKLLVNLLGILSMIILQVTCHKHLKGHSLGKSSGEPTSISSHPWMASIQKNFVHNCAGSIISKNILLTAASCFEASVPNKNMSVRVGSSRIDYGPTISGGSRHDVNVISKHGDFNGTSNNLALVKVSPNFRFSHVVAAVKLADRGQIFGPGIGAIVAGWLWTGAGQVEELRMAKMETANSWPCQCWKSLTCAVPSDGRLLAPMDVGVPLVVANGTTQIGIGFGDARSIDYTSIPFYRNWIDRNIEILSSLSV